MRTAPSIAVLALLAPVALGLVGCSAEATEEESGLTPEAAEESADALLARSGVEDFEAEELTMDGVDDGSEPQVELEPAQVATQDIVSDTTSSLGRGTWGFRFVVLPRSGPQRVISTRNETRQLYGASTFKLFTGWTGFTTASTAKSTLTVMLRRSDNALANLALCQAGEKLGRYDAPCRAVASAPASMRLPTAIGATKTHLGGRGVAFSSSFRMADGSGLSASNRLTVRDLTSLLADIHTDAKGGEFKRMLAQPGVSSTLASRFSGLQGRLFAKTGTYVNTGGGVRALAGFVELRSGGTMVFAVVGNGVGDPGAAMNRIEAAVRKNLALAE
ncbi:MAG: D-alanyl-D-alanine carboxypeptidase [Polyangiaceae bacterium]